jgi:hypothetical protein
VSFVRFRAASFTSTNGYRSDETIVSISKPEWEYELCMRIETGAPLSSSNREVMGEIPSGSGSADRVLTEGAFIEK